MKLYFIKTGLFYDIVRAENESDALVLAGIGSRANVEITELTKEGKAGVISTGKLDWEN